MGQDAPRPETTRADGSLPHRWTRVDDPAGEAVVAGTLRNDSDGPADFTVSIEVRRAGSRAAIGTVRIPLTDVAPGETRRFEFGDEVRPASIECDLVEVTGPAPFGLPAG